MHEDEVDEDEPDEKLESQVKVTKETLDSMQKVMDAIEPIIHDLKDGSLQRVRKSTFVKNKRRRSEIVPSDDDDFFSDYTDEVKDEMEDSDVKISDDDSSSYGVSKDPESSVGKSIKSKQMRSVLQTIEAARKRLTNSTDR